MLGPHAVPSGLTGLLHMPLAGLHTPGSWQLSVAAQVTGAPAAQVSFWVQPLPSLQLEPSILLGLEHMPLAGLHTPATWHWSSGLQVTAVPPHMPPVQTSLLVHMLPSLQLKPSILLGLEHI